MPPNPYALNSPHKNPTLRLEISLSTAASDLADLTPDSTTWHAWAEYFLYCLEEESMHLPLGRLNFEIELALIASAIRSRLSRGNWSSSTEPLPTP